MVVNVLDEQRSAAEVERRRRLDAAAERAAENAAGWQPGGAVAAGYTTTSGESVAPLVADGEDTLERVTQHMDPIALAGPQPIAPLPAGQPPLVGMAFGRTGPPTAPPGDASAALPATGTGPHAPPAASTVARARVAGVGGTMQMLTAGVQADRYTGERRYRLAAALVAVSRLLGATIEGTWYGDFVAGRGLMNEVPVLDQRQLAMFARDGGSVDSYVRARITVMTREAEYSLAISLGTTVGFPCGLSRHGFTLISTRYRSLCLCTLAVRHCHPRLQRRRSR